MKTIIVSAFPACGKTHLFENGFEGKRILDSDSSKFSWLISDKKGELLERDPCFPGNYINHIKENIGVVDFIFVSSHEEVRKALDQSDLCWVSVMPSSDLMLEWVGRCYIRGSNKGFIDALISNWDNWTSNNYDLSPVGRTRLQSGEYLSDKMRFIETLIGNDSP